ncbi:glutathione S-transferase family protein [Halomonas sediminis]
MKGVAGLNAPPRYRLYYSPDSANLVVRMVLEIRGIPYSAQRVDRAAGELDAPDFRRLNPQGLLPVLEDEARALTLFETGAILLHLDEHHPADVVPDDERAARLAWLFFLSNTLHAELRLCFYTGRYAANPDEAGSLRRTVRHRLQEHLTLLEARAGHCQGPWLLPGGPSVLDPYLGCLIRWMQLYPVNDACRELPWKAWPRLVALLEELEKQPAIRCAARAEGIEGRLFIRPDYPVGDRRAVTGLDHGER